MKISSSKKAAILATVLSGFVLGSSAEAAKLGVVTASDYTTSHMGALEGSLINSNDITAIKSVITGLNRDPAVYNTVDQVTGESSIYIRQYNYSTTNLQNSYAFNGQDWNNKVAGNTSGAVNAHDVARYKDFVYVASYDEGTIGVAQVTDTVISDKTAFTRNLKADLTEFAGLTFDSKAQLHGEGVVIIDSSLYVIANCNPQGGYAPYSPSYLIKYGIKEDGRLSYDGYTTMGKNTDSVALNVYNNYMLATAIGGYQFYGAENSNADTSLNYAELDPVTKRFVRNGNGAITLPENLWTVRNGKTIPKSEFRSLKVMPNGTAYVMTYNIGRAGENVDVTVYQTTISNLLSKNPENWKVVVEEKAAPGWFGRLDAEQNTKRLWVQVGNKLDIYTDGATTPLSFGTDSFAANKMYEELYTWDIISTDVIPEGKLVSLQLANGENKNVTKAPKWNGGYINVNQRLENVTGNVTIEGNDKSLINLGQNEEGNLTNNVLAGIYAEGVTTNVLSTNGLQIQVQNNIASPVGIYAGVGGNVNYYGSNSDLNIITRTMDGGNTLTNAVWLDPSIDGNESITLQSATTNITMEGGYGGNGVAIQKTDRWGENSKASTQGGKITITGDLNIKGKDNETWGIEANPTNVLSRFNNAGILVDVNNSSVTVGGNVDMDVYGNGVTVTGDNSTVTIEKGGSITVPKGTNYGYYALAAYDGTINMNAKGEANAVKLDGDIFVTSEGVVNLGLATNDSYLKGIIDNGGTANLTLKNGAVWTNEANNTRYYQDSEDVGTTDQRSHVTKLTGGTTFDDAGTIIQTANSKNLWVDELSGAVKVNYTSGNGTTINGGNVTIEKANENSKIALFTTNNSGIATGDTEQVNAILEALANKLWYEGYKDGKRNLSGVAIGMNEGVVSSSVIIKEADLQFKDSGQGSLIGGASDGGSVNPDTGMEEQPGEGDGGEIEREPFKPLAYPGGTGADNNLWTWDNQSVIIVTVDNNATPNITGKNIIAACTGSDLGIIQQVQIEGSNENATYAGVYSTGNNDQMLLFSGAFNVISKSPADSKIRTNAIWRENNGTLGILQGNDVNIALQGGYGGNGIAITGNTGTMVNFNNFFGNSSCFNIKGEKDNEWGIVANPENFNHRTNNAGILVEADNSIVYFNGSGVNMDVYGNGITVDCEGTTGLGPAGVVISDVFCYSNGTKITVPHAQESSDLKYYSLAAYKGVIDLYRSIGEVGGGQSSGLPVYNNVPMGTQLNGDIYIGSIDADISMALRGDSSYLNGAVVKEDGVADLYLYDGAKWENVSTNGDKGITSHVSYFRGTENNDIKKYNLKEANIIQKSDSGDIVMDNYSGNTKVTYDYKDDPTMLEGGRIVIDKAAKDSKLTLYTKYTNVIDGSNLKSVFNGLANKLYYLGHIIPVDENGNLQGKDGTYCDADGNVFDVNGIRLGNINGKGEDLYDFEPVYHDDDLGLTAFAKIGEGLTSSEVSTTIVVGDKLNEDIDFAEFKDGSLKAEIKFNNTTGQGSLTGDLKDGTGFYDGDVTGEAFIDKTGAYTQPIYGNSEKDSQYRGVGILDVKTGVYTFTDAVNIFNTREKKIGGGAFHSPVGVAISAYGNDSKTVVDLKNNALLITNTTTGSGASIAAINEGVVEINNPGNIIINENGQGYTASIFTNSGGKVHINNEDGGIVTINTKSTGDGAGIKTMSGGSGSEVIIKGLVDITADLDNNGCNEGLSAVASTIEVGGGSIKAINNAWCAIRAYGEFVSENAGVVNVNILKDNDGNIIGADDNDTVIIGDLVTNGGMGTKGWISVGLNGENSSWYGNYADGTGYGVTPGMNGYVNLFMKDSASWTGYTNAETHVVMEGEGTTWYGFNMSDYVLVEGVNGEADKYSGGLHLTLKDGALWQNAISTEQKDKAGNKVDSKVYNFNGDNGFIDMTGNKTFLAIDDVNHAEGSDGVSNKNTGIKEYGNAYQTGNLVISNYSGDTTVIYRHDTNDVTNILGGTTTIEKATAGSNITLSTDSTGIDSNDTDLVTMVLNNLAHKLFYTAYTTGEDNLKGKVQIAEGLTTSSVGKYFGEIKFDANNKGQGSFKDGSLTKPGSTPTVPPSGDVDQDDNEQGGNEGGNQGTTPEVKPVVKETFKDSIDSSNLSNLENDKTFGSVVTGDEGKLDFGKLDKDEHGNDKPASEHVDIVKVEGGVKHTGTTPFVWDMDDKGLSVGGKTEVTGGTYEIQNAGDVTLKGNTEVKGDGTNKGVLKIDNKENGGKVIFEGAEDSTAPVLNVGENAEVDVKGKVEIINTNGKVAVEVAKGSTVALGGGVIGDEGTVAIAVKDGGSIEINKEGGQSVVINGKILLGNPQSKMMMMKAAPKAIVVPAGASSFNLTDDQSSMNDDVQYTGTGNNDFVAGISNGAKWTGNSVGGVDLDVILADGGAWTGYHEDLGTNTFEMEISNGAQWTNTAEKATIIDKLSGEGGSIQMSDNENAGITVNKYSGSTTFLYNNAYGKDVASEDLIKGGDVTIVAVDTTNAANSNVTLRTNSIGTSNTDEVKRVLDALAQKLAYTANDGKLNGTVQIMEGMTGSSVTREGLIKFDASGNGSLDASKDVTIDYTGDYIYGDSETAMMKGAKSAMASTVMMWRSESNDLLQRMGDVRLATEESGVWAKYYGGKYEMDAQNTNFSTSYKAYQVGYDKAVGNGWNVGVAVSHNEGDSRYDRGGEGEMTVTSLSVYGNKDYGDGRYLGLILKGSQLKNEYEVFNNDGYKLEGDFKTWGTSISAEYGKRIEKGNGFYFDPSVELTIGHVQGKDYTATSDMLAAYGKTATMQVEQDDFNSIIGRVGFGIGQRTDKASYYAKLALAHEFGGDFDTNYTAEETKGTNIDFGDTWYEMQLGGTAKLSDNSLLYATYERSFGGDVTEKWRVDAGLRVTF